MGTAAISLDQALPQLASICGPEHVRIEVGTIAVYPAGVGEIAKVLRYTNEHGLMVAPTGNGTKLGWGNPVAARVLLSLERMSGVREHSWQDMTCTVEAGCTWNAMQAALEQHGQMVALDPLWPDRSTVGGIAATNDSGALRLKYGSLRDLILGMTVVLADGTIAKTGGKVVKNVAGYDLHKLMTGSFGTLGVIAEINFRLHPVEEHVRTWTASAPSVADLAQPIGTLLNSQLVPSAVQVRSGKLGCAIDVRIAARHECMSAYEARLRKALGGPALEETTGAVWNARQAMHDIPNAAVLKISTRPDDLCAVFAEIQQWASATGAEIAIVAQAAGLMTVAVAGASDSALMPIQHLRQRLHESGGSVVALQVPEQLRGRFDVWGCASDALPLMREIKRRFDPNRILNPGRFAGAI